MLAALKFFLGQDEAEDAGSDDDEEGGSRKQESGAAPLPSAPSSKEVYAAKAKVTSSCCQSVYVRHIATHTLVA